MKVFLGGTCPGWKWRDQLQLLLNCEYYNPIVKNWSEEDRLREIYERETSDYVLYGITNDIKGVYSIAEVVDDSNKRPNKTIFLNLYTENHAKFDKQMYRSLEAVGKLLESNGARVFRSIEDVANFLNLEQQLYAPSDSELNYDDGYEYPCDSCAQRDTCDGWDAQFCCRLCHFHNDDPDCSNCDPSDI